MTITWWPCNDIFLDKVKWLGWGDLFHFYGPIVIQTNELHPTFGVMIKEMHQVMQIILKNKLGINNVYIYVQQCSLNAIDYIINRIKILKAT